MSPANNYDSSGPSYSFESCRDFVCSSSFSLSGWLWVVRKLKLELRTLAPLWPLVLFFRVIAVHAAEDGLLLYYPCDEKEGTVLHDAGPYHKDGSLNAATNREERGVEIVCKKYGEWVPIANKDGIQRKGIVPGSDSALAEGERPIVLDRDKDYAIDCHNGKLKALEGGRVELGKPFTLDFKFTNLGPKWVEGKKGGGLEFDGIDHCVTLGAVSETDTINEMTLELWVCPSKQTSTPPKILVKGQEGCSFGLALLAGFPVFYIDAVPTKSPATSEEMLSEGRWYHLAVAYNGAVAVLFVNGKESARTSASGALRTTGVIRLSGPLSFAGIVDEIKIYSRAKTAEEIAKDAAQ